MELTKTQIRDAVSQKIADCNPEQKWIWENMLFLHVGGSRLYGTNTPTSDWDIRGVTLAPKSYWIGARSFDQMEVKIPELDMDIVIYDFRKWLHLTVNCNPNVIETLYVPPGHSSVIANDGGYAFGGRPAWWEVIVSRTKPLISRRAHTGIHGYALSQIKKMLVKSSNKTGRRDIVDAHGFDVKFGMHAFRVIGQGLELLETGNITFPRPHAEYLRAIRDGLVYGTNDMVKCVAEWEAGAARLDSALATSVLPAKSDFDAYNRLLISVFENFVDTGKTNE